MPGLQVLPTDLLAHVLDFCPLHTIFLLFTTISKKWQQCMLYGYRRVAGTHEMDEMRVLFHHIQCVKALRYMRKMCLSFPTDVDLLQACTAPKLRVLLDLDGCWWLSDTLLLFLAKHLPTEATILRTHMSLFLYLRQKESLSVFCKEFAILYGEEVMRPPRDVMQASYQIAFLVRPSLDPKTRRFFIVTALSHGDLRVAKRFGYRNSNMKLCMEEKHLILCSLAQYNHPQLFCTLLRGYVETFHEIRHVMAERIAEHAHRSMIAAIMTHPNLNAKEMYCELCYHGHEDQPVMRWFLRKYHYTPTRFMWRDYVPFTGCPRACSWFLQHIVLPYEEERDVALKDMWEFISRTSITQSIAVVLPHIATLNYEWCVRDVGLATLQAMAAKITSSQEEMSFYQHVWLLSCKNPCREHVILWLLHDVIWDKPMLLQTMLTDPPVTEDALLVCLQLIELNRLSTTVHTVDLLEQIVAHGFVDAFARVEQKSSGFPARLVVTSVHSVFARLSSTPRTTAMYKILCRDSKRFVGHLSRDALLQRLRKDQTLVRKWDEWVALQRVLRYVEQIKTK